MAINFKDVILSLPFDEIANNYQFICWLIQLLWTSLKLHFRYPNVMSNHCRVQLGAYLPLAGGHAEYNTPNQQRIVNIIGVTWKVDWRLQFNEYCLWCTFVSPMANRIRFRWHSSGGGVVTWRSVGRWSFRSAYSASTTSCSSSTLSLGNSLLFQLYLHSLRR